MTYYSRFFRLWLTPCKPLIKSRGKTTIDACYGVGVSVGIGVGVSVATGVGVSEGAAAGVGVSVGVGAGVAVQYHVAETAFAASPTAVKE